MASPSKREPLRSSTSGSLPPGDYAPIGSPDMPEIYSVQSPNQPTYAQQNLGTNPTMSCPQHVYATEEDLLSTGRGSNASYFEVQLQDGQSYFIPPHMQSYNGDPSYRHDQNSNRSAADLFTEGPSHHDYDEKHRAGRGMRTTIETLGKFQEGVTTFGSKKTAKETVDVNKYFKHLKRQYKGGSGWLFPRMTRYTRPKRTLSKQDLEKQLQDEQERSQLNHKDAKKHFLNPLGQVIKKYEDVDTYLSPSTSAPRRLLVQSTKASIEDYPEANWRRAEIRGSVPLALRLAEWALDPKNRWYKRWSRCAVVAFPIQALLALPGANAPWEMNDVEDSYLDYTGYHWKWAKHAVNPLDMRHREVQGSDLTKSLNFSTSRRLRRPRQLVVRVDDRWEVTESIPHDIQYIFISWHWGSFGEVFGKEAETQVNIMARKIATQFGITAYFTDKDCNCKTDPSALLTADVNRMSDVIRNSHFVALMLPDSHPKRKANWGARLWTLPEGLLAPGKIRVCTWQDKGETSIDQINVRLLEKTEMTSEFWGENNEEAQMLAEHYQGRTILSRLALFSTAISALSKGKTSKDKTGADVGYALMGLLHHRIEPDHTDDLFQVIARLSLANDSDRLIERMVSMFPRPTRDKDLFKSLAAKDQYETHLWDISPRCQVVGVGDEPNTVILDECRAIPIRWKRFPRIMYKRHVGWKKKVAETFVRSGAWWMVTGYTLAFTYAPILLGAATVTAFNTNWFWRAIVLFLGVGLILSAFAPRCVRRLFGGEILASAPHLVAFEGVMPKVELEKIVFGSHQGRLTYAPSCTPFGRECKHPYLRKGREPDWIANEEPQKAPGLLPGHRLFTLVDTGNLSIAVFQACRPPTVAVITGAEGGMLRAAFCSWRFADDTLYKETVVRLPSATWAQTKPAAWLKMSLLCQDDRFTSSSPSSAQPTSPMPPHPSSYLPQSPLPSPSPSAFPSQHQTPSTSSSKSDWRHNLPSLRAIGNPPATSAGPSNYTPIVPGPMSPGMDKSLPAVPVAPRSKYTPIRPSPLSSPEQPHSATRLLRADTGGSPSAVGLESPYVTSPYTPITPGYGFEHGGQVVHAGQGCFVEAPARDSRQGDGHGRSVSDGRIARRNDQGRI